MLVYYILQNSLALNEAVLIVHVIPFALKCICSLSLLRIQTHPTVSFALCEYMFNIKLFQDTKRS